MTTEQWSRPASSMPAQSPDEQSAFSYFRPTLLNSWPHILAAMNKRSPQQIEAEIKALRARIRRLRLESRAAALADTERELLRQAERPPKQEEVQHGK